MATRWPGIVARDIGILGYAAVREQTTLAAVLDVAVPGDFGRGGDRDAPREPSTTP